MIALYYVHHASCSSLSHHHWPVVLLKSARLHARITKHIPHLVNRNLPLGRILSFAELAVVVVVPARHWAEKPFQDIQAQVFTCTV